jgi:hypothetical protein
MVLLGEGALGAPAPIETHILEDFKSTPHMAEDIIMGMLYGAVEAEGLEHVEGCIKDSDIFFQDVLSAVQDFEKKTVAGMSAGIKKLGEAFHEAQDGIKECKGVEADIEALEEMLNTFRDPRSFVYHVGKDLMINGVQIYKEVADAIHQFE